MKYLLFPAKPAGRTKLYIPAATRPGLLADTVCNVKGHRNRLVFRYFIPVAKTCRCCGRTTTLIDRCLP